MSFQAFGWTFFVKICYIKAFFYIFVGKNAFGQKIWSNLWLNKREHFWRCYCKLFDYNISWGIFKFVVEWKLLTKYFPFHNTPTFVNCWKSEITAYTYCKQRGAFLRACLFSYDISLGMFKLVAEWKLLARYKIFRSQPTLIGIKKYEITVFILTKQKGTFSYMRVHSDQKTLYCRVMTRKSDTIQIQVGQLFKIKIFGEFGQKVLRSGPIFTSMFYLKGRLLENFSFRQQNH